MPPLALPMRPFFLAVLLGAALPLGAQTPPDSSGFDALNDEIRASTVPIDVYHRQLQDAWDRAVVARRYGRADSVAVLAEAAIAETTGLARDSVVWPGTGDRLAVRLLDGDPAAVETLAAGGEWWERPTATSFPQADVFLYDMTPRLLILRPFMLRPSTANVLAQDSSEAVVRLAANGADAEAVAVTRLAIEKLLLAPTWGYGYHDTGLSDGQIALNARADAFLARYPSSRFERFVREEIRHRYRVDGSVALYLGFGSGWGIGGLGEATGYSIAGELGFGVRYGPLHANLGFHGSDLRVIETQTVGDESLVEDDRLTFLLLGLDIGPRVPLGGLDVMPYVSGGLLVQGVSGPEANEPDLSTYEPPNRLGWGYGATVEYLGGRSRRIGGMAVRLRVSRLMPQFSEGFEDVLDGPITSVTLGYTLSGILRTRIE